ncbi:acyl-CoA dehydrogenase family protein, partial [Rugamonas sp.]|uniref:acyl-CoA dehydrogenase family protein n=1 Tax=Rugamonas sp. TaxID=1926287 RepID=UPI0025D6B468
MSIIQPIAQPPVAPISAAAMAHELAQPGRTPHAALRALIDQGLDRPPLPGAWPGATLERWRWLAMVAGHDLSLLKLYEGHTDALAILAELDGPPPPPGSSWGVWCAEPPDAQLALRRGHDGRPRLAGRKAWCSGAAGLSHALVSCRDDDGRRCLAAVALQQPGVHITAEGWHAVGMAGSGSVDVEFNDAPAQPVGAPGAYLTRPGFWHGGAGIAACWYGAARALADHLRLQLRHDATQAAHGAGRVADPHRLAHMGQVDVALVGAAALLRASAAAIDAAPRAD